MPGWLWFVLVAIAIIGVVALVTAMVGVRRNRTERLKQQFGPEYDRTVSETGRQGSAERELAQRQRRRDKLDIVALEPAALRRYADQWRGVQTAFVDDPSGALHAADELVTMVMRDRGYPVDDFDRRAEDISVDHPTVVENYRFAHDIHGQHNGDVSTEAQRQAFMHYRALFGTLLESDDERHRSPHTGTSQEARP